MAPARPVGKADVLGLGKGMFLEFENVNYNGPLPDFRKDLRINRSRRGCTSAVWTVRTTTNSDLKFRSSQTSLAKKKSLQVLTLPLQASLPAESAINNRTSVPGLKSLV